MSPETTVPEEAAWTGWMEMALSEARLALAGNEAPIGAVILSATGTVLSRGHNTMVATGNPIAHAEINAFTAGAGVLLDAGALILVSTLEPCVMCTGAAMQSGVTKIIYGLQAPADAGTGRVSPPVSPDSTDPTVIGGVGAVESRALFVEWMERHAHDPTRESQRAFVTQLLMLTPADARS